MIMYCTCGKPVQVFPYYSKVVKQTFCSASCRRAWFSEQAKKRGFGLGVTWQGECPLELRKKISAGNRKKRTKHWTLSLEKRKHIAEGTSKAIRAKLQREPSYRAKLREQAKRALEKAKTTEARGRQREGLREYWANPENKHRQLSLQGKGRQQRPNYAEARLMNILDINFPGEWKYTGGGQLIIGNLKPDFVHSDGFKAIIELFGEVWHKPADEGEKRAIFTENGYKLLVIWVKELADEERIIDKVRAFVDEATEG